MPVTFFSPSEIPGLADTSVWTLQSFNPSDSKERAQGLKSNGDEAAHALYGGRSSGSMVFKSFVDSGALPIPAAGTCAGGWHIDSVRLAYSNTDWPTLTLSVHKHTGVESGVESHGGQRNTYSPSLSFAAAGKNIPASVRTMLGIEDVGIGIASFQYEMSVTHVDAMGDTGNYLASEDRDGREVISVSTVGIPSADPGGTGSEIEGWDMTEKSVSESNTSEDSASYTFEHHQGRVVSGS